jgi:CRISPR-associated exonuclease Cas4
MDIVQPSLYNAYLICPRQAWLMYHCVDGDQMNEFLYIGRLLSEKTYKRKKHELILADLPAKIDMLESNHGDTFIAEIKKSSKMLGQAKQQLKYYLYLLHKKGYDFKGIIKIPQERYNEKVILTEQDKKNIKQDIEKLKKIIRKDKPPQAIRLPYCRKCSHFEFCFS